MRSTVRVVLLALLAAALFFALRQLPTEVEAYVVERGDVVGEVLGTGTLEARVSATISAKISGRVARVLADQGDTVEPGTPLLELDDEELTQQVAIAQADVDASRAAIERTHADKARAAAVMAQAQRTHARITRLATTDATTEEEVERAAESLAIAAADVSRAEASIVEAEKGLIAAEKSLEYQRARLRDTRVHAPFAGLVTRRQREAGDVVVPGSPVLTLVSTDVLWISAWVDETAMAGLAVEQPARIVFRSQPTRTYAGEVARLGKETDRETREFVVDVRLLELPEQWAVGQRAEVYIETARSSQVVALPLTLLDARDGEPGVFVDESGIARWRPLVLGVRSSERVEVREGLAPSDVVVGSRSVGAKLADGARIRRR